MKEKINEIEKQFDEDSKNIADLSSLEELRLAYLGKKGKITDLMTYFRVVPAELKKEMGMLVNNLKNHIEESIAEFKQKLADKAVQEEINRAKPFDITLPVDTGVGSLHPRTIIQKQVVDIFSSMGFIIEDGNEIETEYNNFIAVNVPETHPARDMQDTFWLDNGEVLKTQTSAAQNRILRTYGPKCKVLFPGRCFRNEAIDASHENTFFQIEGVVVDENVSVANLIYFMKKMLNGVFKKDINVRLRPGYFPFTEPSFELDASCPFCGGKGCSTCGNSGWIELCPCGMIHPNVLKIAGVDPEKYNGFAFGLGMDRLVMIKSGLDDIRHLNAGEVKLLRQFKTKIN
ncbi:MAG: phenylalanine--tRNA ligase subunit alpha [Clostridia bacterium]|nr:phenylalanine--tRNA ligase subunit alpha [Clostridia bacterium]